MVMVGWDATVISPRLWMDISLGMVGQRVVESSNNEDTGVFGRQRDAPNDDMGDVKGVDACGTWLSIRFDELSEGIP